MGAGPGYSLQGMLPAEVLVGGTAVWSRYRQYPVFSRGWLVRRSLLFCSVIAVVVAVIGLGTGVALQSSRLGLEAAAVQFLAFCLMATLGPALGTWVRHRRWRESHERWGVVIAVLLGMVLSYSVDRVASAHVEELVRPRLGLLGSTPPPTPELGVIAKGLLLAVNLAVLAVIYGLFGGGLALRAYFSERRRWEAHNHAIALADMSSRAREADLRLGVLQAQVEPHFLFNTLASVRALVRQDPAQAEATLDALVTFLRATIPRLRDGQGLLSTLGQQLDICASYLALMEVRMGGRLSSAVRIDEGLRELPFPPALLITLVENAIKHGIEPRPGPGRVEIIVGRQDGNLVIRVIDDGAGLKPGLGGGMGLANVREQLAQRFGSGASLRLQPAAGGGVVARIDIACAALEEARG